MSAACTGVQHVSFQVVCSKIYGSSRKPNEPSIHHTLKGLAAMLLLMAKPTITCADVQLKHRVSNKNGLYPRWPRHDREE